MSKQGRDEGGGEKAQNELKLKIDAHVVRQLGEELISDPEQAILELVKNSYDADSPWCNISIDTGYQVELKDVFPVGVESNDKNEILAGRILISDRGCGMTREQVDKGWLTISHSEKRDLKENKRITEKFHRAYQGDKGLGRLSSMKLGRILKIKTSDNGKNGLCVTLDWHKFQSGYTLDEVPLEIEILENTEIGTTIEIIQLNDLQHWQGEFAGGLIQSRLSSLLDPFGINQKFKVSLEINDLPFPLTSFTESLIKPTVAQFEFNYDTKKLICKGKVRLPYYMPTSDTNKTDIRADVQYKRYLEGDQGEKFLSRLLNKGGKFKSYKIERAAESDWFCEFSQEIPWEEMPKGSVHNYRNTSEFKAQWYYFFKKGPVFDLLAKGKIRKDEIKALEDLVGVGVYKNDFRVGANRNDWLGFSSDKTSGRGFYSIRPENIVGYIKFDGYEGEALKEKSDRQGFVQGPAYNGFWIVTRSMMAFANDFLNVSRREANSFINECREKEYGKPENYAAQTAAAEFDALVYRTEKEKKRAQRSEVEAEEAIEDAKISISSTLDDMLLDEKSRIKILSLQDKVNVLEEKFNNFKVNYLRMQDNIVSHKYTAEKIVEELNESKHKIDDFYESAAVGLSAENLAHDINPLLDEISLNSSRLKSKLKDLKVVDKSIYLHVNKISSTVRVIGKDVSLINPMLRSRRNISSNFRVRDLCDEYIELRKERFAAKNIDVCLSKDSSLSIKFVKGKFIQILDNLFRNSEYWLEVLGEHSEVKKVIYLDISESGFGFWDSGPGVYERMEDVLFDMFESGKGRGQGLGLFIISTILHQSGCSIELLQDRNQFGRRYKFYVNLSGAIEDY